MATKTFVIDVQEKGFDKTNKEMSTLNKNVQKTNKAFEEQIKLFTTSVKLIEKVLKPLDGHDKTVTEMLTATSMNMIPTMEKINILRKEGLILEKEMNDLKIKNLDADIKSQNQIDDKIKLANKSFEEEEKEIKKRRERKITEEKEYIDEKEKLQEKGITRSIRLSRMKDDLEKTREIKINEDIAKNATKRIEILKDLMSETIKETTAAYEQKRNIIVENNLSEIKTTTEAYDKLIEAAKENNEERAILEEAKKERLIEINKDLNNKLLANTQEQLTTSNTLIEKGLEDVKKKTAESIKNEDGVTHVKDTRDNNNRAIAQLKAYKKILDEEKIQTTLHYAGLEEIYKDDAGMLEQVHTQKALILKNYDSKTQKIETAITETTKKNKGLQMKQFEEYGKEIEKKFKEIEKESKKIKDIIEIGFKGISFLTGDYTKKAEEAKKELEKTNKDIEDVLKKRAQEQSDILAIKELAAQKEKELEADKLDENKNLTEKQISIREEEINKLKTQITDKNNSIEAGFDTEKKLNDKKQEEEKKLKEAETKQKKAEILQDITKALADISVGVTKALKFGPILGPILAAGLAVKGAIEINNLRKRYKELDSDSTSKAENGGLLRGKRHSGGGMRIEGTNIEVEGGEYVVNRESTNKNLGLIRYINSQRKVLKADDVHSYFNKPTKGYEVPFSRKFESGGELPTINNTVNVDNEALVEAIRSIKFSPKVAVTDIIRAQDEMARVDGWTGM
ncbi:MAG: hypothetical protein QM660_05755 [Dysgonomonas sp.]